MLGLAFLLTLALPGDADQPTSPLLEAALQKRAEVERVRAAFGPAPRLTDHDLAPDPHRPGPDEALAPSGAREAPLPPVESAPPPKPAESESDLRERLADLEAALVGIGASGLPLAPRDPNRFRSALDAARIRAEMEDIRRELAKFPER